MEDIVLSIGNNLGNKNSSLMSNNIDANKFKYNENLMAVFDNNFKFKSAILRKYTDFYKFILNNKEYNEWFDKNEDCNDLDVIFNKQLEISKGKYDNILNEKLNELKAYYKPMVDKIYDTFEDAKEYGKAKKIIIKDGKAVLYDTYLLHNIPILYDSKNDINGLKNRKAVGILASEWFGAFESFSECSFCASFYLKKGISPKTSNPTKDNDKKYFFEEDENKLSHLTFIIDTSSPELQKLIKLDFFEYLRCKNDNNLSQYNAEELDTLDKIEQLSSSGMKVALKNKDWAAIPAGIPPQFIVGIMADKCDENSYEYKLLNEASKIFNVPVIDRELNVICEPNMIVNNTIQNSLDKDKVK